MRPTRTVKPAPKPASPEAEATVRRVISEHHGSDHRQSCTCGWRLRHDRPSTNYDYHLARAIALSGALKEMP